MDNAPLDPMSSARTPLPHLLGPSIRGQGEVRKTPKHISGLCPIRLVLFWNCLSCAKSIYQPLGPQIQSHRAYSVVRLGPKFLLLVSLAKNHDSGVCLFFCFSAKTRPQRRFFLRCEPNWEPLGGGQAAVWACPLRRVPGVLCGKPGEPRQFSGSLSDLSDLVWWVFRFSTIQARGLNPH